MRARLVTESLALALALCWSAPLSAAPNNRGTRVEPLAAQLRAAEQEQAFKAIDRLADLGSAKAIEALSEFVQAGQPDALLHRVLQALRAEPSARALPLLAQLTRHRRAEARRLSYLAIAAVKDPQVPILLGTGLRDSDADVRGASAHALGEIGARSQLPLLFRALSRGVPEAAEAIGKLGDEADLERYHAHLEQLPMPVMLAGYAQFLERTELKESAKLELVARLGEVASPRIKQFLLQLLREHDWSREPRLRHAVGETAQRIADRPQRAREAGRP